MFDHILEQKKPLPGWLAPALAAAILFHVLGLSAAIVHGYWDVDMLPMPKSRVELVVPAPSPPPPAAAASRPQTTQNRPQLKPAPNVPTQPVRLITPPPTAGGGPAGEKLGLGLGTGAGTGLDGSDCVGITCGDDPTPPPGSDGDGDGGGKKTRDVAETEINREFVSGERQIHPDDATRTKMSRDGLTSTRAVFKMCLSSQGRVISIDTLRSSGYPDYDARIRSVMRTWKYRPFSGDTILCAPITFQYNLR